MLLFDNCPHRCFENNSVQVAAVIQSTELSLSQTEILIQQLREEDILTRDNCKSRSEILRTRKVIACTSPSLSTAALHIGSINLLSVLHD